AECGVYHLDGERINLLNALIGRREKGFAGACVPLDTSSCSTKKPSTTEFFIESFRKIKRFLTTPGVDIPLLA
ncbi:MAG: hypothetical protein O2793_17585, partial [Proteobacteria bacterium]|nr:hypothetical protein [Pseudomonadota bacterium]